MTNALNYIILTTDGEVASGDSTITFNEAVPSSGYPFMLVSSSPFEIIQADSQASTYVINVTRAQESTSAGTISDGSTLVCELTHESLDDVYSGLLRAEKIIGENYTTVERTAITPDENQIAVDTDLNKVYIGVAGSPNTWEELDTTTHAGFSDLLSSTEHTQYYTEGRADTWHDNLNDEHLDTLDHDHLDYPAANIRDLDSEPADTTAGNVYYNKTSYTLYYYDGSDWKQYSTVPQYALIFRDDGQCPNGWTEKTEWDGYYLKGEDAGYWIGGSGGSLTHTHDLVDIPQHSHTLPDRDFTLNSTSHHAHSFSCGSSLGGSKAGKASYYSGSLSFGSSGSHTHTITVSEHDVDNSGQSSPTTQSSSSEPKRVELTVCEKD